ncbi:hypothetical protein [Martelella alba]|uniref:MqsR (Motility quorum-sensing regulator) toxin of toxin-antitoxin system n=1 Tax=Martelella alba TaxID=2590451 RepID=A0ABY2SNS0_9HYPH|nr:hypothetical protein [Martelella alba]TKI07442.1 hypothetical protein FCN80_06020 [Martelella alba]
MGFNDIKKEAIKRLKAGAYTHEARGKIDVKNLFATGQISEEYVIELITKTSGDYYCCYKHYHDSDVMIHILKPYKDQVRWYVKFYFYCHDIFFISVHHDEAYYENC